MPFFKLRGRSTKSMQRLNDDDDQHLHIDEIQPTNKQSNTATPPMDTNTNNNINKISYTMTESPHSYNPEQPQGRYNNNNTNSSSSYQSQSSNASQSTTDISRESNKIFTSAFTTSNSFDLLLDGDNFNNVFPTVNNNNTTDSRKEEGEKEIEINSMGPEFFESNLISSWDDGGESIVVNNTMNKEDIITSEEEEDPPAILQQMSSNEVWFDSSTSFPNNSSINQQQQKDNQTRLVSPDTSQKLNPNHPRQLEEAVDSFTDFGSTNFFINAFDTNNNNKKSSSSNGFEKNVNDDDFFGNSWTDVDPSNHIISLNESSNDPWGAEVSFSISKDDSITDEESSTRKEFSSIPKASLVWDDGIDDKEEENHPLKSTPTKCDSSISHRPATAPSSRQQQNGISNQQQQLIRHTRKKSGGSIGSNKSNSSTVDQILEQYKQKRIQKKKDRVPSVGRTIIPITPNSGGGSSSVNSASGYSPGSSATSPRGVLVTPNGNVGTRNGIHKSTSATSLGHQSNHSGGSSSLSRRKQQQHRRNISNDSISRVIDNLTPRATSPSVGTHYPPPPLSETSSIGILRGGQEDQPMNDDSVNITDAFLISNIEATIGPRGVAPDLESLSGRSGSRSLMSQQQQIIAPLEQQLQRPSSSKNGSRRHRGISSSKSVNSSTSRASRASRTSFRTYQTTKSALSTMSKESKSVANDLFRLEAQLAEQVAKQQQDGNMDGSITVEKTWSSLENVTYSSSGEELNNNYTTLGATPVTRGDAPFEIHAPAGKLGIVLSNNKFSQHPKSLPTHVSAVRSSSILAGQVQVGDILMSIDNENVMELNAKEIMSIMARKSDQTRVLRFRPAVSSV